MPSSIVRCPTQRVRVGGYCSVVAGLCFLFGMWVYVGYLMAHDYGNIHAPFEHQIRFMAEHALLLYGWYFIIYVVFGLSLLGFQIGVLTWLNAGCARQACAVLGYLWVGLTVATGMLANVGHVMILQIAGFDRHSAMLLWYVLQMLMDGLGGGHELVGGVWMVALGTALVSRNAAEQRLKMLAFVMGAIGVLSSAPGLSMLGGAFGVGCTIWFLMAGVMMIRHKGVAYV